MQLGDLEKMVLNYFWSVPQANAKQVHSHFSEQRGGSLNTIQSTLDRLYKKQLLKREKRGHAFVYSAASSRTAFIGKLVQSVTQDFIPQGDGELLAAFVSRAAELDDSQLSGLEEMINAYESKQAINKDGRDKA